MAEAYLKHLSVLASDLTLVEIVADQKFHTSKIAEELDAFLNLATTGTHDKRLTAFKDAALLMELEAICEQTTQNALCFDLRGK